MSKIDLVFKCRKCGHNVFIEKQRFINKPSKIAEYDCLDCGEEGYENWIFSREGNYNKEHK